ncbi:MAG: UDP-N-acetylglucosamine 1-carboxyvinyltransferase, partial [bacterium]|nr:UDP-N-acetylglucosamine 1-carboxyvinyltransferase [bacterium]
ISVIDELPKGRKPIKTTHRYDTHRLQVNGFIKTQIDQGRQVYVVYPLIDESEKLDLKHLMDGYDSITRTFPDIPISVLHGQMPAEAKDFEMARFKKGETKIMVATTVIEVGVDVPNASVMIIESAQRFGLSQLHQLRGRVGRGAEQSYCILMTDHKLSAESKTRIETMVRTNNGFEIAEVDLKLRGPGDLMGQMRSSIFVMGPMLGRLGRATVAYPGGCDIGPRPIDLHLRGFEALGAKITIEEGYVVADGRAMKGSEMTLEGPQGSSVGATCNVLMAAVLTSGRTVIRGAAREPEVGEVVRMLNLMGARVAGADSSTLEIDGVEALKPVAYSTIPDRIEAGTFLLAAAITGGDVMVRGARPDHLNALLEKMIQAGCDLEIHPDGIRVRRAGKILPTSIHTLPYPGFPTDMQAQFMSLLCLAEGESVVTEGIYPERFIHVAELMRMGASIRMGRGEAIVKGVEKLTGAPVMASDLRASAALILAGLAARGTTEILRVYHIDRGYEQIDRKLAAIGARITRETTSTATPVAAI